MGSSLISRVLLEGQKKGEKQRLCCREKILGGKRKRKERKMGAQAWKT